MLDYAEKLLQNTLRYSDLMSRKLPVDLNEEQVYDCLLKRTKQARAIMKENVELISDHFEPFFQNPHLIGRERAECYEELAAALYKVEESVDVGLALQVHKALLERARLLGDTEAIIRHLYWTGLIYLQWSLHLFVDESFAYFDEACRYRHLYFSLESREARLYFNRCMGNRYVAVSQKRNVPGINPDMVQQEYGLYADEAAIFWNDLRVRELDPDFPWDGFLRNIHQNTSAWMDQLRGMRKPSKALVERIYRSVQALASEESANAGTNLYWQAGRTEYLRYTSRYHAGVISLSELLEKLREMTYCCNTESYSNENIYRILHLSAVYQHYLALSEEVSPEEKHRESEFLLSRAFSYYREYNGVQNKKKLDKYLIDFIKHFISDTRYKDEVFSLLLKGTSFSHLPTYAHSVMVGEIMAILAERFIEHRPEVFVGMPGLASVAEVTGKRALIIEKARRAGYAHDAGKIDYVETVAISSRKISDLEFEIIKNHTAFGYQLFAFTEDKAVLDVILGHHKYFDGSGGYPAGYDNTSSDYKFLIDLCSIADIVDAGTDEIGRSYTNPKTLATLREEIRAGAGRCYSPVIAEALADQALMQRLEEQITTGRKTVYYRAYRDLEMDRVERDDGA